MPSTEPLDPPGHTPRRRPGLKALVRACVGASVTLSVLVGASAGAAVAPDPATAEKPAATELAGTSIHHGQVTVDGGKLHYVRAGSGPPLLMLHGWPQTWWEWRSIIPELARTHTVIAFDLPGLGDSSAFAGGFDKVTTARRIRQGVQRLGVRGPVEILAHDVGTLVAYPYARDFPTEVSRIAVLESPLSGFGLEDLYGVSWHFQFNASPAPIPEQIMDNQDVPTYLGMLFDFSFRPEAVDREVFYRAYADPRDRTAGYEYYRAFAGDAADNQANAGRRLAMPVLAMGGQYSFGPGVAASFRQVADDVRESVAPDAGHYIPEENPRFLADCAALFFGAVTGPPARPELASCVA